MKEKTTIFVVSSKFCGDFFIDAAFSTRQQAEDFITQHEMSSGYITELTIDEPSEYTHDLPFRPTPRHYEDFDEIQKAVLRKIHDEEKSAENKRQETSKVPQVTSYGECTHPQDFCDFRSDKGECLDVGDYQICKHNTEKTAQNTEERVNHPKHYQHPSGVECITVARHHDFNIGNALKYIWRAGLKQEQGISPTDKQIEDLQKAAFYIQDEIKFIKSKQQEQ